MSEAGQWERSALECLDDMQALETKRYELAESTGLAPVMLVATARNQVHARAVVDALVEWHKKVHKDFEILVEGYGSPWAIVSAQGLWVHIMSDQAREYYQLEDSWEVAT